jgi:hypothetical protein
VTFPLFLDDLTANLASREVAGAGVRRIHAVIGMDVDLRIASLHRREELRHRPAGHRVDEVRRGECAFGEYAVVPSAASRRIPEEEHGNRSIRASGADNGGQGASLPHPPAVREGSVTDYRIIS